MRLPGVICKCGSEDIFASQSKQHIKLICAKCGRYIKFANKNEKNLMQEILQRNPFNENIKEGGTNNETKPNLSTLSPQ